jgi:hypothetical protein
VFGDDQAPPGHAEAAIRATIRRKSDDRVMGVSMRP